MQDIFIFHYRTYSVSHKNDATLFSTIIVAFIGRFFHTFGTSEKGINTLQCVYLSILDGLMTS